MVYTLRGASCGLSRREGQLLYIYIYICTKINLDLKRMRSAFRFPLPMARVARLNVTSPSATDNRPAPGNETEHLSGGKSTVCG